VLFRQVERWISPYVWSGRRAAMFADQRESLGSQCLSDLACPSMLGGLEFAGEEEQPLDVRVVLCHICMGRVALTCRRWQHWSVLARQSSHSNSRACLVLFDISWDDMNISFCSLRVPLGDADDITRTLQPLYGQYPRNSQFLL
jgi:hypothetical protein